jgi:ABC-type Na+ efflux pump permease subunit
MRRSPKQEQLGKHVSQKKDSKSATDSKTNLKSKQKAGPTTFTFFTIFFFPFFFFLTTSMCYHILLQKLEDLHHEKNVQDL